MKIFLLGTGTCAPYLRRGATALAVKMGGELVLFDSGPGTMERMLRMGLSCLELDHLFYSHAHLDHTAELFPILFSIRNTPGHVREKDLHVWGSQEFRDFYKGMYEAYRGWIESDRYRIHLESFPPEGLQLRWGRVAAARAVHGDSSLAYRLEDRDGKAIVFSGDTDYCEEIVELSRGTDILFLECSTPDEYKAPGHLSPSLAGRIAREAEAKKMVLIHMYPMCDDHDLLAGCRKEFSGEAMKGEDLMTFDL